MAVVALGPLITGIRGKLGGLIWSENQAGTYVKLWGKGPNPRSMLQSEQRGRLGVRPAEWRALNQAQRDAWDTWAALGAQALTNSLGETYYISGFLWYVKINNRLEHAGRAVRNAPPAGARPGAPALTGIEYRSVPPFAAKLWFGAGEFGANDCVLHAAVTAISAVAVKYQDFYWVETWAAIGGAVTSLDFTTNYDARWIDADDDWRIFVRVYQQSTEGLRSSPWSDYAIYPQDPPP